MIGCPPICNDKFFTYFGGVEHVTIKKYLILLGC